MPKETKKPTRVRLTGLHSSAFVSPTDRVARENLEKLPLLPVLIRKFNELALDRLYYVNISATSVRCGPNQFESVYRLLQEACEVLDVPEPELYLAQNPLFNAFTAGVNRPFIVLQSGIVDHMTDDELLFILAHELGHIKCGHVLYQMIGFILLFLLEEIGKFTMRLGQLAGIGVLGAFFEWMRQAEFSCDRAGMLVCQDKRVALSALMKLGCGGTRFLAEMDPDEFLRQARAHADSAPPEGIAKAILFLLYNWQLTHPQVVYRAKGLDDWITTGAYDRILSGDYPRNYSAAQTTDSEAGIDAETLIATNGEEAIDEEPAPTSASVKSCPACGAKAPSQAVLCPQCGGFLNASAPPDEEPI
jgi:Zn-dependent protease with chaperone function